MGFDRGRTIFKNTHEAIIDQETFDNVQRIRANVKRYLDGRGEAALLTGLSIVPIAARKCMSTVPAAASAFLNIPAPITAKRRLANNRAEFVRTVQETQAAQQASDISREYMNL